MLNKIKPKSEFTKNVLTLMTGTTIAQAIPIAISPILTRLYTPEDFGVFALFIAIVSIFGSIANGRYELAIMLPKKDEDAINIMALGFIINIALSLILLLIVIIFHDKIVDLLNNKEISPWLYLVPLSVFLIGCFNLLNYFNNRKKYYKDLAKANVYKSIGMAIIQLSLGFLKAGAIGLISGQIFSQIISNTKLFLNVKRLNLFQKVKRVRIIVLGKNYINFPFYNSQHALINIVFSKAPIFIISKFFSNSILGFYALAIRIIQVPVTILGNSISSVLYQKIVEYRHNKQKYMNFIYKFLKVQLLLGILIFLSLYFSSFYMGLIFGKGWEEVGNFIRVLIPWLFMVFIVSPLAFSINMTNNQKAGLMVEFIYGVIKIVSLLIGVLLFKEITTTLLLFSISCAFFLFFQGVWFINLLKKGDV